MRFIPVKWLQTILTPTLTFIILLQTQLSQIYSPPSHTSTLSTQVDLAAMFPGADPNALDLLSKMLEFNPDKRITAVQVCVIGVCVKLCVCVCV